MKSIKDIEPLFIYNLLQDNLQRKTLFSFLLESSFFPNDLVFLFLHAVQKNA